MRWSCRFWAQDSIINSGFFPPHVPELMQWKAVLLSALPYGLGAARGLPVLLVLFALCIKCGTLSSNHSGLKFANLRCWHKSCISAFSCSFCASFLIQAFFFFVGEAENTDLNLKIWALSFKLQCKTRENQLTFFMFDFFSLLLQWLAVSKYTCLLWEQHLASDSFVCFVWNMWFILAIRTWICNLGAASCGGASS